MAHTNVRYETYLSQTIAVNSHDSDVVISGRTLNAGNATRTLQVRCYDITRPPDAHISWRPRRLPVQTHESMHEHIIKTSITSKTIYHSIQCHISTTTSKNTVKHAIMSAGNDWRRSVIACHNCKKNFVNVMTAQTMSFRYELACEGYSTEKAQDLVT